MIHICQRCFSNATLAIENSVLALLIDCIHDITSLRLTTRKKVFAVYWSGWLEDGP